MPSSSTTSREEKLNDEKNKKITAHYGTWTSPIIADIVSGAEKRLGGISIDSSGSLILLESCPNESGPEAIFGKIGLSAVALSIVVMLYYALQSSTLLLPKEGYTTTET